MGLARRYRIRRKSKNSQGEEQSNVVYSLVTSDTEHNVQFAVYPSTSEVGSDTEAGFKSRWSNFLTILGMSSENINALLPTLIYEEVACNYDCKLTILSLVAVTSTSIKVQANVNSSLLIGGIEFSINGTTWFGADADTGNTFTFTQLEPATNYTITCRERQHPKCLATLSQQTTAPEYVTIVYDYSNSDSLRRGGIARLRIGATIYDLPNENKTQQVLVGSSLLISIFPTTQTGTDLGWNYTTILRVSEPTEGDKDSTASIVDTTSTLSVQFTPQVANRVYTIKIV